MTKEQFNAYKTRILRNLEHAVDELGEESKKSE